MFESLKNHLKDSFDAVRHFSSDAQDAIVTNGLKFAGDVGGATVDLTTSFLRNSGMFAAGLIPLSLMMGETSIAQHIAGSLIGGVFLTPMLMAMDIGTTNMENGTSWGSSVKNYMHDMRNDYVAKQSLA